MLVVSNELRQSEDLIWMTGIESNKLLQNKLKYWSYFHLMINYSYATMYYIVNKTKLEKKNEFRAVTYPINSATSDKYHACIVIKEYNIHLIKPRF